jgi:hypothetical protein
VQFKYSYKTGLVLIIFGAFIPLFFLCFVSGYVENRNFFGALMQIDSVLISGQYIPPEYMRDECKGPFINIVNDQMVVRNKPANCIAEGKYAGRLSIPYKYILAFGLLLIMAGTLFLVLSR